MILSVRFFLFFMMFLSFIGQVESSEELDSPSAGKPIEFKLKNGLRVCLKPTSYEEETVVFQLFAMGGYACLSFADRPSGMLAADIARELGLGDQTADQVSFDLYQRSIEMCAKINPLDRQVEAYCYTQDLETCLKIINLMFTRPKFEPDVLRKTINKARETIRSKSHQDMNIREAFLKLHHHWDIFAPLTLADLDYVSLIKAERFYRQCFTNPAEFVFVLVGDFDAEEVRPLLEKHLGSIPLSTVAGPLNPPSPPFPPGITKKSLDGFSRCKEPLTRLTFPIPAKITGASTQTLNCICHLIKDRLQCEAGPLLSSSKKIEVSYEFPFFPKLDEAWLTVQFYTCAQDNPELLANRMIKILNELKIEGPTQEELDHLCESLHAEEMEIEENTYLLSLITNYYRANWNLNDLNSSKKQTKLEKEMLKNDLNQYLKLDQYSVISLHR